MRFFLLPLFFVLLLGVVALAQAPNPDIPQSVTNALNAVDNDLDAAPGLAATKAQTASALTAAQTADSNAAAAIAQNQQQTTTDTTTLIAAINAWVAGGGTVNALPPALKAKYDRAIKAAVIENYEAQSCYNGVCKLRTFIRQRTVIQSTGPVCTSCAPAVVGTYYSEVSAVVAPGPIRNCWQNCQNRRQARRARRGGC
jgi:hypothetical protein